MIAGIVLALTAGALISVQTMFNNKVSEAVPSSTTTALVLGTGFLASLILGLLFEGSSYFHVPPMPLWFWFSGLLGIGVVNCVVKGVKLLGASYAISIVMASQLICAVWWDSLGWFGLDKVPFSFQKLAGAVLLIGGIILFKAKPQRARADQEEAAV